MNIVRFLLLAACIGISSVFGNGENCSIKALPQDAQAKFKFSRRQGPNQYTMIPGTLATFCPRSGDTTGFKTEVYKCYASKGGFLGKWHKETVAGNPLLNCKECRYANRGDCKDIAFKGRCQSDCRQFGCEQMATKEQCWTNNTVVTECGAECEKYEPGWRCRQFALNENCQGSNNRLTQYRKRKCKARCDERECELGAQRGDCFENREFLSKCRDKCNAYPPSKKTCEALASDGKCEGSGALVRHMKKHCHDQCAEQECKNEAKKGNCVDRSIYKRCYTQCQREPVYDNKCKDWASYGKCKDSDYVKQKCGKQCKEQAKTETVEECDDLIDSGECYKRSVRRKCPNCKYGDPKCEKWARDGRCNNNAYVEQECEYECKDQKRKEKARMCKDLIIAGECYRKEVRQHCTECEEKALTKDQCKENANGATCSNGMHGFDKYMHEHCKKDCECHAKVDAGQCDMNVDNLKLIRKGKYNETYYTDISEEVRNTRHNCSEKCAMNKAINQDKMFNVYSDPDGKCQPAVAGALLFQQCWETGYEQSGLKIPALFMRSLCGKRCFEIYCIRMYRTLPEYEVTQDCKKIKEDLNLLKPV